MIGAATTPPPPIPRSRSRSTGLTQAERSEETRSHLIAEARRYFTSRGYAASSTTQIADAAGVSRGALHHHFPHKRALFEAVYQSLGDDLAMRLRHRWTAHRALPRWAQIHHILDEALDQATDPAVQQIVVIDGPSVLRLPRCHQATGGASYEALHGLLEDAQAEGLLSPDVAVDAATYLLFGACADAAHWIATAEDTLAARRDAGRLIHGLLQSLRAADAA